MLLAAFSFWAIRGVPTPASLPIDSPLKRSRAVFRGNQCRGLHSRQRRHAVGGSLTCDHLPSELDNGKMTALSNTFTAFNRPPFDDVFALELSKLIFIGSQRRQAHPCGIAPAVSVTDS